MTDIIIDTCTLVHANNSESPYFDSSVELINKMFGNQTLCTVDDGFSLNETQNKSYIALEYIKHLQPGSLGFNLIVHLALNQRLDFVSNKIPNNVKKYTERIIRNKKDRYFIRVTYNSVEKTLASHDFTDYQIDKRKLIKRDLNISIVTAEEINDEL
ncbi:MAG: hypothetical protein J0M25_09215 [Flavobacteriales bacterium]|nr:hypothetical protein [Flavobacteriales bacterium]